ncbi:MAG: hypothetical protein ACKOX6_04900 [Bdellovibrio sp.]
MSRYHGHIVFGVVFFMFIGLIGMAEVTKVSPAPTITPHALVITDAAKKGGFNLAQVLIEQEVKSHLDKKIDRKHHQLLVRFQVKNLSQDDLTTLKTKALNQSSKWEERAASIDLLELAGVRAKKALQQIAQAPVSSPKGRAPASSDTKDQEKMLRNKALAALGKKTPQKVAKTSAPKNQRRLASVSEARTVKR